MALRNVKELKRTTKALFIGPTNAGKTYPGLQLEGPIAVYDGEDGVRAFRDTFDFDVDTFHTIDELNRKLREEFLGDPEVLRRYNSVLLDGLTVAWHAAIREAEEGNNGRIEITDQAKLKRGWKEFNELVFRLGKANKNVWATVQAKADWEIKKGHAPRLRGMKGDVADKVWFAFDIVCYIEVVDGVRTVSIMKSRYPHAFQVGDVIQHFDVATHFAPIFDGTAAYVEEGDSGREEIARSCRELGTLLRQLGSQSNGGMVPDADARRIYNLSLDANADVTDVANALRELRDYESKKEAAAAA